jgi:multidrug efflux system outer membrane protein
MKWQSVFQDEVLQNLIKEALTNNYDIRIAATHILEAEASLGVTRSNQLPAVNGTFGVQNQRSAAYPNSPTFDTAGLQLSYIVDFWGQFRRATEAARAQLLATQYAQHLVETTLISDIATAYYQLRQLDSQLDFRNRRWCLIRKAFASTRLTTRAVSMLSRMFIRHSCLSSRLRRKSSPSSNRSNKPKTSSVFCWAEIQARFRADCRLIDEPHLSEVPWAYRQPSWSAVPMSARRKRLWSAANANVGVAKAAFFPQIPLTASFGAQSTALTSFLQGPATFWALGGQLAQPLYAGGRITSQYHLALAQRDEAELTYKQTVQQAFADVSNSLVGYNQSRLYRVKLQEQTATYKETSRLANVRFTGGATSFLEVLTTQQQYFSSELQTTQAWFAEMQNYVQLYQALGGGW